MVMPRSTPPATAVEVPRRAVRVAGLDPARLLHLGGGDELALGPRREVLEGLALLGGELARAAVEDAEGGHRCAGVVAQRHPDVGLHAVADDRQVAEACVVRGVADLERSLLARVPDRRAAEGVVLGQRDGVEALRAGEARQTVVEDRDRGHGDVERQACEPGDAVQARVGHPLGERQAVHRSLTS